jgi:hypothetical protein
VLLGFQFQAFFQEGFAMLSGSAKYLSLGGLVLIGFHGAAGRPRDAAPPGRTRRHIATFT